MRPSCILALVAVLSALACGGGPAAQSQYDFGDSGSDSGNGSGDRYPKTLPPTFQTDGDCPPSAKLIYVTGEGAKLYSFDPTAGKFSLVSTLSCVPYPTHMTVDRHGTAWVAGTTQGYFDAPSGLFEASTTDGSCTPVAAFTPRAGTYGDFALTFLGATSAADHDLYLLGGASASLGVFDTETGMLSTVAQIAVPGASVGGDMTTNGDGTLYFLEASKHQTLYRIEPSTGAVLSSFATGHDASQSDQALAFYGGLFFDFLGREVYTLDLATQTVTHIGTAPLEVTGAGESTCVPTKAPPPAIIK